MTFVKRVYVKKKDAYKVDAKQLKEEIITQLHITSLMDVDILQRYDIQGVSDETLQKAIPTILSEPMVDDVFVDRYSFDGTNYFVVSYLKGQYDQRADACMQCFQLLDPLSDVKVNHAFVYVLYGDVSKEEIQKIQDFLINPVDQCLISNDLLEDISDPKMDVKPVEIVHGFNLFTELELQEYKKRNALAMSFDDLIMVRDYFKNQEQRDPTITEIKVLDTYWSDHCRHTTFNTHLEKIAFEDGRMKEQFVNDYNSYLHTRNKVYEDPSKRPITLMDVATINMKELRKEGKLKDVELSKEINACSIETKVHTSKQEEDWLVMFKNETHNHPTEIEPFGGASTCLGGAIRDPLSGRAYVYQSMRITGAGDPRVPLSKTLPGKLPQRKLCKVSAKGFSSYGNQIGLATGYVHELYDDGYLAKRLECGAVIAAAKKEQVKRFEPQESDVVILIGGRTGRDGIGGATGSSKSHVLQTTRTAGAEVQKGNAVEERKIQRLFRNEEVSKKIIRCNDFGAGGVCVAVGELADSLDISLDAILKKYEGLDGTELAISESQERMAVVVRKEDVPFMLKACHKENLEAVIVAEVTNTNRLKMYYKEQTIVDLSRDFLNTNGATRKQNVRVNAIDFHKNPFENKVEENLQQASDAILSKLSVCSQKGLVQQFDSSIGNGTVISPFGGTTCNTESEGMCCLLPVLDCETTTCSCMSYGYNPTIAKWSPYHGAMYAIVESIAKMVGMGVDYHKLHFSFQEFFEKLLEDEKKWGKPFSALLGAYHTLHALKLASIGGKDSMSGSFESIDVPPTFISFAVGIQDVHHVVTPELKGAKHKLVEIMVKRNDDFIIDFTSMQESYDEVLRHMQNKEVYSTYTVKDGGVLEAFYKMAFGNEVGVLINDSLTLSDLTYKNYGNIIVEVDEDVIFTCPHRMVGHTIEEPIMKYNNEVIALRDALTMYEKPLEEIYPSKTKSSMQQIKMNDYKKQDCKMHAKKKYDKVRVTIPVFPGTNCEYDSMRAFKKAGAEVRLVMIRNKTTRDILESIVAMEDAIYHSEILMFAGGFSAGDEPEGSGKFIATFMQNERIQKAMDYFLNHSEGLILGICNGFQALIKLGLLPDGKICARSMDDPTLTFNKINRHVAQMVRTRVCSTNSPWLKNVNVGDVFVLPVSHGEGRFVAPKKKLDELFENGQVVFQYVDPTNIPTMESPYNPNGSMMAIEAIVSKDGRILGKMAHSERIGKNRNLNIYGEMDQKIFEAGVAYFK